MRLTHEVSTQKNIELKIIIFCKLGLDSSNCSVDLTVPPTILTLSGKCDTSSSENCEEIEILGSGFVDTQNLTCHVTENVRFNLSI